MKKVLFVFLFVIMFFLNFNIYAKANTIVKYEEYTGKALSDEYEEESNISTYGAIIIDPALDGDMFEPNDTFATATNINKFINYENNKCEFSRNLSIKNHSNGNVDYDYFYFSNKYANKFMNIIIDSSDLFKYNISLYSANGQKYVLIQNSYYSLNYANLQIGDYVIKICSRNNSQADYKLTVYLERQNDLLNQENLTPELATSIYPNVEKMLNCDGEFKYLKFSPNSTAYYKLSDECILESVYMIRDNVKNTFKILNNNVYLEKDYFYYFKLKTQNVGSINIRLSIQNPTYIDSSSYKLDFGANYSKIYNQLFPKDDLGIFMCNNIKSNIDLGNSNVVYRIDNLYDDFYCKYYGLGYTNNKSIELNEDEMSDGFYFQTIRVAVISYNRNSENEIVSSDVDYLRFNYVDQTADVLHEAMIFVTMNFKYHFDFINNELSLVDNISDLFIENTKFQGFSENSDLKNFDFEKSINKSQYKIEYEDSNTLGNILWKGTMNLGSSLIPTNVSFAISSFEFINSLCDYFKTTKETYDEVSTSELSQIGHFKTKEIVVENELKESNINNLCINLFDYNVVTDFTIDEFRDRLSANDYAYFKFEYGSKSKNVYSFLTFDIGLRIPYATLSVTTDFGYCLKLK